MEVKDHLTLVKQKSLVLKMKKKKDHQWPLVGKLKTSQKQQKDLTRVEQKLRST